MAKEAKSNYDNLPLSKLTLEGSNFNINDLKILKVFNDRQDQITHQYISDTYDIHATLIIGEVKKMLDNIKDELILIHREIKEIRSELGALHLIADENRRFINELQRVRDDHENRIAEIEKRLNI